MLNISYTTRRFQWGARETSRVVTDSNSRITEFFCSIFYSLSYALPPCTLLLYYRKMKIQVRLLTNESFEVELEPTDTVSPFCLPVRRFIAARILLKSAIASRNLAIATPRLRLL